MTTELDVWDQAHQYQAGLRGLDDRALADEETSADYDEILTRGKLADLRQHVENVRKAHGPSGVSAQLENDLRAKEQAYRLAQLRLTESRAEVTRRQELAQAQAAERAQAERAQLLTTKRSQAWAQYDRDAGVDLNGTPRADQRVFDARWNDYLVDLALGRVTLPA